MIIYKVIAPSGKVYVGQTVGTLARRRRQHRNGKFKSPIANAIRKYGDALQWSIIARAETQAELNALEVYWIAELNALAPCGYNLRAGGEGGGRASETTRKRMSKARKGIPLGPQTPAHRAAIGAANKGRIHTPQARANMRGHKLSAETCARMSASRTGVKRKPFTAEHIANMSAAQKARYAKQQK